MVCAADHPIVAQVHPHATLLRGLEPAGPHVRRGSTQGFAPAGFRGFKGFFFWGGGVGQGLRSRFWGLGVLPRPATRPNNRTVQFRGRADYQQPPDHTGALASAGHRRPLCARARQEGWTTCAGPGPVAPGVSVPWAGLTASPCLARMPWGAPAQGWHPCSGHHCFGPFLALSGCNCIVWAHFWPVWGCVVIIVASFGRFRVG